MRLITIYTSLSHEDLVCSILTTRPVGIALILGDSFVLYSRYYSFVDFS